MMMATWRLRRGSSEHPGEDALAMLAFAGLEAADGEVQAHVGACRACADRLASMAAGLADDREAAQAEAERQLTPRFLERQRAAIRRRLGGPVVAARILAFPAHGPVAAPPRHRVVRRSVAAAAVAGLLVGVTAGRLLDPHRTPVSPAGRGGPEVLGAPALPEILQASAAGDEAFLRDFESAIGAPRVEPLRALEELTPQLPDGPAPR
jgi:hypothetical protein